MRRQAGDNAIVEINNIEKAGFETSKITRLFKEHVLKIRRISNQLENDSDM